MNNLDLLQVYRFDNKKRLGILGDGGYLIGLLDCTYDCYISAGVGYEESFTLDFLSMHSNLKASDCFAFDGTVETYPYHYTQNITFVKKNIGAVNDDKNTNLFDLIDKYDNLFMKMDIEGGEYPWLLSLEESQLKKFKQLVFEFHGITDDEWNCCYNDKVKCLEKLKNTHFLIHAHGNNNSSTVNRIPEVVELTYVNKEFFPDGLPFNTTPLPIQGMDYRNCPARPEIDLNFYPFVQEN